MKEINYEVKHFKKTLTTKEFFEKFYNFELVQGFCKECPRYDTNYSCSPINIDIKNFVLEYDFIDIHVTQLFFEPKDYEKEYISAVDCCSVSSDRMRCRWSGDGWRWHGQ